jgi:nucleoid-associated protein YgaU
MPMQRDMKVGMALGVALVGIVGALFFRRDPAPQDPPPPPLQGAEELDRQISEKPKGPYIQGLDEFAEPAPAPPSAKSTAAKSTAATSRSGPSPYEVPGFLTKDDEAEHRAVVTPKQPSAPDPISTTTLRETKPRETGVVPEPPPAHNRDWVPAGAPASHVNGASRSTAGSADPATVWRTHVTQPGETLSSLAAHYLGSSARYREIYEANRNVLRSPDDLPDGVTLAIPDSGKPASSPSNANHNHTAESAAPPKIRRTSTPSPSTQPTPDSKPATDKGSAVSGELPSGKLRFAPVTRGPFSAGRINPASRAVPPPSDLPTRSEKKPARPRIDFEDDDPF